MLEAVAEGPGGRRPGGDRTLLEGDRPGTKMAILRDRVGGHPRHGRPARPVGRARCDRPARRGVSRIRRYGAGGEVMGSELAVYIQAFSTQPRMVIFGAIDFSAEMAKVGERDRLPGDDLRCPGPVHRQARGSHKPPRRSSTGRIATSTVGLLDRRDVVLVFTHDSKFDEPALIAALRTGAGYIGALGSRRTQERRVERLRAAGLDDSAIAPHPRPLRPRRRCPNSRGDGHLDSR